MPDRMADETLLHFAAGRRRFGPSLLGLRIGDMTSASEHHPFTPTRAAGLQRLSAFVPTAGKTYANGRNFDDGPGERSHVSMLSPYLRHRLITEHEVLDAVLQRHKPANAEKFVQEVYWRTYFKGHLETRPQIWQRYREAVDHHLAAIGRGGGIAIAYREAIEGRTGIDCFDAWIDELRETGYLHNHARMWLASIWIFTLKLPWELGADFTYRHFIDGDPASNTLSWRWVGGLHTKGKTYLARASNIAEYTRGRFDPKKLAGTAPPLDEPPLGPARMIPAAPARAPSGPAILLVTEDDLHPESLDLSGVEVRAVAGLQAGGHRSPEASAELVLQFAQGARADGVGRAAGHFGVATLAEADISAAALVQAAHSHGVARIVTAYAPVGPTADRLAALNAALSREGIEMVQIRRPEDTAAWPSATKGFFGLKEKIPHLLGTFGIGEGGLP